jgi:hypothetical protein
VPPEESRHPSAAIAKGQGDITNQGVSLAKKKIEDESKAADFLEALGRPDAICCDCGEPGRVGKQRCASCAVKLRNDRRRERQKRKKAAQPTVDKPEPICYDCRGRAQIGINGRPRRSVRPASWKKRKPEAGGSRKGGRRPNRLGQIQSAATAESHYKLALKVSFRRGVHHADWQSTEREPGDVTTKSSKPPK